ncbi:VanZ family protein [Robertmurraya massiliosenegalensis]|uniref:VanZ family protein n=1 Tax=Robertmurraya massiliosenegalensis TaxID=1287657 RepID=UPI00030AC568|nr:VanZ family protein [Robertmurraya massiliosenegalensis]
MRSLLKWFIRVLPFIYMGMIWLMSSMPANAIVELPDLSLDRFIKESLHLVEFAILYLLLVAALLTTGKFSLALSIVCAVIASLYGLLDEIHQSFVPARSATVIDFVKDVTGVIVATYFVHRAYRKHQFERVQKYFR